MMGLAKAKKIDLILTKSLSRFARNVVDCLDAIRTLKSYGTEVFFETDNISSFDPKIEFVISVLAGMAEEEARNVSENVKWNVRRRFEQGQGNVVTKRLLGYDTDKEGNLVINSYQAEIVRLIYRMYIFGSSINDIIKELEKKGVKSLTGLDHWAKSSINYILKNDIYTGGMTLQKTFRPDYHSKLKRLNKGEKTKYEVSNTHPAIISKEDFDAVQMIIAQRQSWRTDETKEYANHSAYTGKFVCGHCGKNFHFRMNNRSSEHPTRILVCANNVDRKNCDAEIIFADVADAVIDAQINLIRKNPTEFMKLYATEFEKNPEFINDKATLEEVKKKIGGIRVDISDLQKQNNEFSECMVKEFKSAMSILERERIQLENKFHTVHNVDFRLERFRTALRKNTIDFADIFDHIEVFDRNQWVFHLKSGNATMEQTYNEFTGKYIFYVRKTKREINFGIKF